MKLYMNKLTPYEHHEIFNYPQIYFIGANAKKRPGIIGAPNNCGYDDDQGPMSQNFFVPNLRARVFVPGKRFQPSLTNTQAFLSLIYKLS
jgi:hypothetical protein